MTMMATPQLCGLATILAACMLIPVERTCASPSRMTPIPFSFIVPALAVVDAIGPSRRSEASSTPGESAHDDGRDEDGTCRGHEQAVGRGGRGEAIASAGMGNHSAETKTGKRTRQARARVQSLDDAGKGDGRGMSALEDFRRFVELLGLRMHTTDHDIDACFERAANGTAGGKLNFTECAAAVGHLAQSLGLQKILPTHWGQVTHRLPPCRPAVLLVTRA